MSELKHWVRARATGLTVAALVGALFLPFVGILLKPAGRVLGEAPFGDNPAYYFFAHDFVARSLRGGDLPLWNPHALLGFPQLAEGQAAIFHPLNLLHLVLPAGIAINWVIALSIVLMGVAFWWYLRSLGLGNAAAWCAALVCPLSGRMAGRIDAGHLNMLVGFISWPLILGTWERYRATGRVHYLGYLALAYGALIVAGYPQFTFIFSLFFLCYVVSQLFVLASNEEFTRHDLRAVLLLGLFVALGVGISAAQLLPSIDFAQRSSRSETNYDFATTFSLPPESLLTALTPGFFGHATQGNDQYWGRGIYWEICLYIGMLPLVAAVVGAFAAPRAKRAALAYTGILFFLLGLGSYTPLFRLLYDWVPLASLFRGPGKYSAITLFCLATLAGYGLQAMFDGFRPQRAPSPPAPSDKDRAQLVGLRAAVAACAMLILVNMALLLWFFPARDRLDSHWGTFLQWVTPQTGDMRPRLDVQSSSARVGSANHALLGLFQAMAFLMGVALLIYVCWKSRWRRWAIPFAGVLLLADLGISFSSMISSFDVALIKFPENFADVLDRHPYPPRVHDASTGIAIEKDGQICRTFRNGGMGHGYTSVSGYAGNYLARYARTFLEVRMARRAGLGSTDADWTRRFFHMLSVDYLICHEKDVPPGVQVLERHVGRALIPLNPFYSRVRLLRETTTVKSADEAFRYITNFDHRPSAKPVLETTSIMPAPLPFQPNEYARITSYANDRVEVEAWAAQSRVLLLAEMYDSNWHATVNGISRPIIPANYLLRAVRVPAGKSHVVFEYVETWFPYGILISVTSLLTTLGIIVASHYRGQRNMATAPADLSIPPPALAPREEAHEEPAFTIGAEIARWRQWGYHRRKKP